MIKYSDFLKYREKDYSEPELNLLKELNDFGAEFIIYEHPPLRTVEESKTLRGKINGGHTKNLYLRDKKKNNYLVTANENQEVDLKNLASFLSTNRLSFGSPDRLNQYLGVKPGAVSPLALINDKQNEVVFYIDQSLLKQEILNFHPLINTLTISLKVSDFKKYLLQIKHTFQEIDFNL